MRKSRAPRRGASPSDGPSSIKPFGRAMRARPMANICCSPPESVPVSCVFRSASSGKRGNTHSWPSRRRGPEAAPPGDVADSARHGGGREEPVDRPAVQGDRPSSRTQHPGDRPEGGGLAGPVGADQRHDLPVADLEGNAPKGLDIAVENVEILDSEHAGPHSIACLASLGKPRETRATIRPTLEIQSVTVRVRIGSPWVGAWGKIGRREENGRSSIESGQRVLAL